MRRATRPSTASSASATDASARSGPGRRRGRDRRRASERPARTVTAFAGPLNLAPRLRVLWCDQQYGDQRPSRFSRDRGGRGLLGARAGPRRAARRAAARAGPGRGAGPHAALRREPGHRVAGLPRRGAGQPARPDARPVPGGRLPGSGEVRLPQRRRRRGGPPALSGGPSSACTRTRRRTSSRPRRSPSCRTASRRAGRCWPGRSRPRSTRCGTLPPLLGDRVTVVGAGMVGCCVARLLAGSRGRGDAGRRRPGPRAGRRRPRRPASPSPATRRRAGPRGAHQRDRRRACSPRWTCSRRRPPSSS